MSAALDASERSRLAACEQVIERGLKTFVEVGEALREVRDSRLYRAEHATFANYCLARWGFRDSRARQLIAAAETATTVTVDGAPAPSSERVARELPAEPTAAREVWSEAVAEHGGRPTARQVAETRQRVTGGDELARSIVKQKLGQGDDEAARAYADAMGVEIVEESPSAPERADEAPAPRVPERDRLIGAVSRLAGVAALGIDLDRAAAGSTTDELREWAAALDRSLEALRVLVHGLRARAGAA